MTRFNDLFKESALKKNYRELLQKFPKVRSCGLGRSSLKNLQVPEVAFHVVPVFPLAVRPGEAWWWEGPCYFNTAARNFFFARPLESAKGLMYITKRLLQKMKTQRNQ